jgi:excisionase family DNA binding protein
VIADFLNEDLEQMTLDLNEYVTASDAARILGVSRSFVNYLVSVRDLFAHKFGPRTVLVRRADVERLKEKRARR